MAHAKEDEKKRAFPHALLDISASNQLRVRDQHCAFTMRTWFQGLQDLSCLWHKQYPSAPEGLRCSRTGLETSWAQRLTLCLTEFITVLRFRVRPSQF